MSTRLAVVSDIHGNVPALRAVLADARTQACDGLLVAGDAVGGVADDEVVGLLRDARAVAVRGNNEGYLLALARGCAPLSWHTSQQWAALRWSWQHTTRAVLEYIAALPQQRTVALSETAPVHVVHGSPLGVSDGIHPDEDPGKVGHVLAAIDEPVLVCGHTHQAWTERRGPRLVLNAGSAGSSCNGDPRAWYGLLTWDGLQWQAEVRAVDYDRAQVRRLFEERGLLAAGGGFARAVLQCVETGIDVPAQLCRHARRLAAEAGLPPGDVLPDALWERAVETFERGKRAEAAG